MRYTLINGLLLLAISPFRAVALPVDPSTQPGQWDPNGHYRKGHYENGRFIPNVQENQVNQYRDGQNQNERWNNGQNAQWNNDQNHRVGQNGVNNWDRESDNRGWQRRSLAPQPFGVERLGDHRANLGAPGIHARNWPNDQNNQNGWTDQNGQWHANNQNGQGWTDQNGQWHANNNQNGQGWTDQNGQWHPSQKRAVGPAALNNGVNPTGTVNPNAKNIAVPGIHARSWPNDQNNQNGQGWTDRNGQWHPSNQNGQGWTDQNGQWHSNNQNGQGWTDRNGQWHPNQKREWRDDGYNRDDRYNNDGYNNHDDYHRNGDSFLDRAAEEALTAPFARRWWPFNNWNNDNDSNRDCERNDSNCRNRNDNGRHGWHSESYRDQCQGRDWRSCRNDNNRNDYNRNDNNRNDNNRNDYNRNQATPTPSVVARQEPARKDWTRPTSTASGEGQ